MILHTNDRIEIEDVDAYCSFCQEDTTAHVEVQELYIGYKEPPIMDTMYICNKCGYEVVTTADENMRSPGGIFYRYKE